MDPLTYEALIRNPEVAKVCFTGSVGGGKKIMELASASLTRVTLELGGNDAAVILQDAILDDAHLDRLFAAIYDTTGQICMAALAAGITPFVRVPANTPDYVSRVLDGGALGIIAPHVGSAQEARAVVKAAKFPPLGERSNAGPLAHLCER